jgi:ABC-type transporter Mla subunit MlaD
VLSAGSPQTAAARLRRRRAVGVAVLVVAVVGSYLAIVKPNPFHHTRAVRALFTEAQGLTVVQRDVRVGGVRVGRVGKLRRIGDHAEVELLLDQDVGEIHRDARAEIRPHTPFEGTVFIELDPGSPSAPPLGDRRIGLSHTRVYVSLDEALRVFNPDVRQSFKVTVHEFAKAITPPAQRGIQRTLRNAPALLRDAGLVGRALRGPRGDELRTLIPAMDKTVDALAREDELPRAIAGARRTLDGVAADDGADLGATLAALPGTLRRTRAASDQASRVLDSAHGTFAAFVPMARELRPTAQQTLPLLRRMTPPLRRLPGVVDAITGTLTQLAKRYRGLMDLFDALQKPATISRNETLPALEEKTAYGLPAYLQVIAGFSGFTGALAGFATPAQDPLVSGHGLRGTLNGPVSLPLPPGSLPIPCSAIAALNPQAVTVAKALGLCE